MFRDHAGFRMCSKWLQGTETRHWRRTITVRGNLAKLGFPLASQGLFRYCSGRYSVASQAPD